MVTAPKRSPLLRSRSPEPLPLGLRKPPKVSADVCGGFDSSGGLGQLLRAELGATAGDSKDGGARNPGGTAGGVDGFRRGDGRPLAGGADELVTMVFWVWKIRIGWWRWWSFVFFDALGSAWIFPCELVDLFAE